MRSSLIDAKRAEGGETYGYNNILKAKSGEWLCRNPENGYCWVMSDEGFDELYCEVGKYPEIKPKKQQDGHRKGKSRHMSASSKVNDGPWGSLFAEEKE
jgi:hypothetical protein